LWQVGGLFSLVTPVSSTNKTDCHNITEILLKVALNTKPSNNIKKNLNQSETAKLLFKTQLFNYVPLIAKTKREKLTIKLKPYNCTASMVQFRM
jgi:hypothetical protein